MWRSLMIKIIGCCLLFYLSTFEESNPYVRVSRIIIISAIIPSKVISVQFCPSKFCIYSFKKTRFLKFCKLRPISHFCTQNLTYNKVFKMTTLRSILSVKNEVMEVLCLYMRDPLTHSCKTVFILWHVWKSSSFLCILIQNK